MDLASVKGRVKDIEDYANELGSAYEALWDSYLEASREIDELLERVKELEEKYEEC